MVLEYKLDEKDIIRIIAEHFQVKEEEIDFKIRTIQTGWEMAPITKYIPEVIVKGKI